MSIKTAIVLALAYTATRTIRHDGVRYQSGDLINLEERFAKPLLECGAVVVDAQAEAARATVEQQTESQGLSKLTVEQLKALAAERQIDVPSDAKKADLIALLTIQVGD
jgi:hypothetical protein